MCSLFSLHTTVQLDLNLTLASAVHACVLWLVPSIFVKCRVFITTAREIAEHNTLRATCKSHHTSMQDTCVISMIMARRKRWEGYLCKHTYPFVLIDSISFRAYHH